MICSIVQSPMPVALSGVRLLPAKAPRPGTSNATSEPPSNFVMSGLPRKVPGVWQSPHPITVDQVFAPLHLCIGRARRVGCGRRSGERGRPRKQGYRCSCNA